MACTPNGPLTRANGDAGSQSSVVRWTWKASWTPDPFHGAEDDPPLPRTFRVGLLGTWLWVGWTRFVGSWFILFTFLYVMSRWRNDLLTAGLIVAIALVYRGIPLLRRECWTISPGQLVIERVPVFGSASSRVTIPLRGVDVLLNCNRWNVSITQRAESTDVSTAWQFSLAGFTDPVPVARALAAAAGCKPVRVDPV